MYGILRIKDIPNNYTEKVKIRENNSYVFITKQNTGFGAKRFLICPNCDSRRANLYLYQGFMLCRSCLPFDIYKYRRNLYDEGGTRLIEWYMNKLLRCIGINTFSYPFHYWQHIGSKPIHTRQEKFLDTLKKVQVLENMRFSAIIAGKQFTAVDIKKYISKAYIDRYTLQYLDTYVIFASRSEIESFSNIHLD